MDSVFMMHLTSKGPQQSAMTSGSHSDSDSFSINPPRKVVSHSEIPQIQTLPKIRTDVAGGVFCPMGRSLGLLNLAGAAES